MRRLLLTQSQAVVTVSSAAVVVFTVLLFLWGYILQQRTVTNLQATLRPRLPRPPVKPSNAITIEHKKLVPSRFFHGDGSIVRVRAAEDSAAQNVDWTRLAHVQIAHGHEDVCDAIMILAELHRMKSPARKVLLFPKRWTEEKPASKGDIVDPFMDASRRLLRLAFRRYGVDLRPMSPITYHAEDDGGEQTQYSLASAFALTDLDRVLAIQTPSMVLDASILDGILAYTDHAPFAMLNNDTENNWVHPQDLMLLQPNAQAHQALVDTLKNQSSGIEEDRLAAAFERPMLLAGRSDSAAVVRSIGELHDVVSPFNATGYLEHVAFLRFSDPKLPGPQYEVPFAVKRAARPSDKDAEWTWTKLYGDYAYKRREICGLELATWHEK